MMEAEETVMEGNQIAACYRIKANTTPGILWEDARKAVDVEIATRQAEISFREGMKKVVEWFSKYYESKCVLCSEEGKAQLKEWGIEQSEGEREDG